MQISFNICWQADREDESLVPYYEPLHPAVLHLIRSVTEVAGRAGRPLTICGEMAGDPQYTDLLLGLGLRRFSVSPGEILGVKCAIRRANLGAANALARGFWRCVRWPRFERCSVPTLSGSLTGAGRACGFSRTGRSSGFPKAGARAGRPCRCGCTKCIFADLMGCPYREFIGAARKELTAFTDGVRVCCSFCPGIV